MPLNVVWSTLYLGHYSDLDSNESSYTVETKLPTNTTIGTPTDPLSDHIVNVTTNSSDGDVLNSNNTATNDTLSYNLGGGTVTAKLDSLPLMAGVVTFADGTTATINDLSVFQDTQGNVFLAIRDNQPLLATQAIVSITFTSTVSSNYSGLTQSTRDDLDFVPTPVAPTCFAAGTLILTPSGERPVQALRPGDPVTTLDSGPLPILFVQRRTYELRSAPDAHHPVRFPKGCFGTMPERNLTVSQQHRMLLRLADTVGTEVSEVLAPAKCFVGHAGVRILRGLARVEYYHLLLPRHALLLANGLPAESLWPGEMSLRGMDKAERARLFEVIPELRFGPECAIGPLARPAVGARQGRELLHGTRRSQVPEGGGPREPARCREAT